MYVWHCVCFSYVWHAAAVTVRKGLYASRVFSSFGWYLFCVRIPFNCPQERALLPRPSAP